MKVNFMSCVGCSSWEGRRGEALKDEDNLGEGELNLKFKVVMEKKGTQVNTEYQVSGETHLSWGPQQLLRILWIKISLNT